MKNQRLILPQMLQPRYRDQRSSILIRDSQTTDVLKEGNFTVMQIDQISTVIHNRFTDAVSVLVHHLTI